MIPIGLISPVLATTKPLGFVGAQFMPAFNIVSDNEGGYANDPNDLGRETYRGIARAFHPNWEGWAIIDFIKARYGEIPLNTIISKRWPQYAVIDTEMTPAFYQGKWTQSRAGEIRNQQVANIYFDFFILASEAVLTMQQALNRVGFRVAEDNRIGPQTINAINQADPAKLHDEFKRLRVWYHNDRVRRGVVHAKFKEGWMKRTAGFPNLLKSVDNIWVKTGLFLGAVGLVLAAISNHQKIKLGDFEKS